MKRFLKYITLFTASITAIASLAACGSKATTTTSSTAAAGSDQSFEKVQAAGVLKLGLDDSLPPLGFRDEHNQIVGFDIDVAQEVAKRLNLKLEPVPIDWSQKMNELDAENIDCLWNGFSYSKERDEACTLSKPYLNNDQVLVTLKDSGIQSLEDMNGKQLSLQEQSSAEQALDENEAFKNSLKGVVPFKDNITAFKDIEAGQTDGLLIDSVMAEYYISNQPDPSRYVIAKKPLASESYVIGFKKGAVALKDKVESALSDMVKDGTLAKISTQWFGDDITTFGK